MSNTADTIARLDAESAITRLLVTYAHLLDDGKFDQVAELLQHATMEILGETARTRDGIEKYLAGGVQRHGDGTPRTWHSVSNILIDVDACGEKANSVCYFTVHQELDGFPLQPICTGRYVDTFEMRDGEWRFVYRLLKPRHFGNLHNHVGAPIDKSKA